MSPLPCTILVGTRPGLEGVGTSKFKPTFGSNVGLWDILRPERRSPCAKADADIKSGDMLPSRCRVRGVFVLIIGEGLICKCSGRSEDCPVVNEMSRLGAL